MLVVNNGMYGTIRMHQERHYPGRVVGTDLVNPDFAAYARAFGAHGARGRAHGGLRGRPRRGARRRPPRRCSSCASTPRRSRRARRWPRSGRRRGEPPRAARPRAARAHQPLHRRRARRRPAVRLGHRARRRGRAASSAATTSPPRPSRSSRCSGASWRPPAGARRRRQGDGLPARHRRPPADQPGPRRPSSATPRPASTLVEVSRLAVPGARLEVEAVALLGA